MAQKGIREYDTKRILANFLVKHKKISFEYSGHVSLVTPEQSLKQLAMKNHWMQKEPLVVKPDQLFGKRGKHNLVLLDATFKEAENWIAEHMHKKFTLGNVKGELTHFLVEPFVKHRCEHYLSFTGDKDGDKINFAFHGGLEIESRWDEVVTINIPILEPIEEINVTPIMDLVPVKDKTLIKELVITLFNLYSELHFGYLEFNPFTIMGYRFFPFDAVARLDDTAQYLCEEEWGIGEFPDPFGQTLRKEEKYIRSLDETSGSSLKLKILNPKGKIWTMVAGGGASVIYADTVVDLGYGRELANYGEYSGNPSRDETFEYARTILELMTKDRDKSGKILIIGGGIANFTDVAATFAGIILALEKFADKIREYKIKIFLRRGGPNYTKGLELILEAAEKLKIPLEAYGPEMHMTNIVRIAIDQLKNEEVSHEAKV